MLCDLAITTVSGPLNINTISFCHSYAIDVDTANNYLAVVPNRNVTESPAFTEQPDSMSVFEKGKKKYSPFAS